MNTKIPVKWSNFWNSHEMFPLLVDPAIEEDRFTFNDNEVTFFTDLSTSQEERQKRLIRYKSFWGLAGFKPKNLDKKKRIIES